MAFGFRVECEEVLLGSDSLVKESADIGFGEHTMVEFSAEKAG